MAFSLRSSRLASVGLASIIAVGVIGAGSIAFADEPASGSPGRQGEHAALGHKLASHGLIQGSGVTREELKEGAAAGLTLAEIIDQYGDISSSEAKANALAQLSERLDAAVAEGKISQERADELEANAPALIDRMLATVPGANHDGSHRKAKRLFAIAKHSLETVAEILGTDVATVREQLASGQTVADIAGDQTQEVVDALVEDANAAIDNAVAEGKLPADKADEAEARAAAAIEKFVNEGRPDRPEHPMRKGMRPNAR